MNLPVNINDLLTARTVECERLKFTEDHSTGIPKIFEVMKSNGSPPPEFDFDEDHDFFMVRLPVHPAALEVGDSVSPQVTGQVTGQVGTKLALSEPPVTPPVTPPVSDHVGRLLALLEKNGAQGNTDIREAFQLKDRRRLRETYIDPALAEGFIEYTIPDKPTSRLQKYRLTEKGRVEANNGK